MKKQLIVLACLALLSSCDSMDSVFGFDQSQDADAAPQSAQAMPAAPAGPAHDAFCRAIAQQDATSFDFDTATQARVAQHSYQQCLAIYGS